MKTTTPSPVGSLLSVMTARVKQVVSRSDCSLASCDVTDARSPGVYPRLVELLSEHGQLGYQSCVLTDAPWQIFWSRGRQSFLPFLERRFTLVAFCDPVGPEQDREAVVRQFFDFARTRGKYAVFLLVTESVRRVALDCGCAGIWLGAEMFFHLAQYTLDTPRGKAGRTLRQDIHHMLSHLCAITREIYPLQKEMDRQAMGELERLWKSARPERSRDSILGTKPMASAHLRRYFAVETPAPGGAAMQSFQVCSPVSRRGWFLHDLVRRPGAPRGAAELAVISAMDAFRAEGVAFVTTGLVPFYDPSGRHTLSKTSPLLRWGISYYDRQYHFSGVRFFRAKISPTRTENAYLLYWPPILTPPVVWETCSVL